jgi:hypothetical protein
MIKFINHPADLDDLLGLIRDKPMGYAVVVDDTKPKKGTDRYERWLKANKFFHTAIVKRFSDTSGISRSESKEIMQLRNALVAELPDSYLVESISSMSLTRLVDFNEQCMSDLLCLFGEVISLNEHDFKNRLERKQKVIKK